MGNKREHSLITGKQPRGAKKNRYFNCTKCGEAFYTASIEEAYEQSRSVLCNTMATKPDTCHCHLSPEELKECCPGTCLKVCEHCSWKERFREKYNNHEFGEDYYINDEAILEFIESERAAVRQEAIREIREIREKVEKLRESGEDAGDYQGALLSGGNYIVDEVLQLLDETSNTSSKPKTEQKGEK